MKKTINFVKNISFRRCLTGIGFFFGLLLIGIVWLYSQIPEIIVYIIKLLILVCIVMLILYYGKRILELII